MNHEPANTLVVDLLSPPPQAEVQGRSTSGRAPPRTRETMSPPHRKFPKALKNCAEVIELGKDAISYCLVRRAPRQTLAAPKSHFIAQRRAVWDHTKCTSGRQPCPRAAVASRSFARSRRRRAERVRSGDDDVASGGGARIVHRRRGARAVLHVADAPVIEMNARSASNSTPEHRSEDPALTPPSRALTPSKRRAASDPGSNDSSPPVARAAPTA
jgi:hypothetical protein